MGPSRAARGRRRPYQPRSIINVSAMSFGSLGARAIESLNRGVAMADAYHNSGEGGVSPYHRTGADVMWQLGTGYFGARDSEGNVCLDTLEKTCREVEAIRAIEIKLSQGAKPGHGGVLPAAKITPEIAEARGVPMGVDCVSPAGHSAFSTPIEFMEFLGQLRELSGGKPVGLALGELGQYPQKSELQTLFQTLDEDGSGTIEYKELHKLLQARKRALLAWAPSFVQLADGCASDRPRALGFAARLEQHVLHHRQRQQPPRQRQR